MGGAPPKEAITSCSNQNQEFELRPPLLLLSGRAGGGDPGGRAAAAAGIQPGGNCETGGRGGRVLFWGKSGRVFLDGKKEVLMDTQRQR